MVAGTLGRMAGPQGACPCYSSIQVVGYCPPCQPSTLSQCPVNCSTQLGFVAITAIGYLRATPGVRTKLLLYFAKIGKDGKSALKQAETLTHVIASYGIAALVVGIASDGASDVTCAIQLLAYLHSTCWVHTISNVVKDAACVLEEFLAPLRAVVKKFRASNKLREAAEDHATAAASALRPLTEVERRRLTELATTWAQEAGFDLSEEARSDGAETSSVDCLLFGLRQSKLAELEGTQYAVCDQMRWQHPHLC
jgi:hypothetical protein